MTWHVRRSNPIANPPCGGIPRSNIARWLSKFAGSIGRERRDASKSVRRCSLWPPVVISMPWNNRSKLLAAPAEPRGHVKRPGCQRKPQDKRGGNAGLFSRPFAELAFRFRIEAVGQVRSTAVLSLSISKQAPNSQQGACSMDGSGSVRYFLSTSPY